MRYVWLKIVRVAKHGVLVAVLMMPLWVMAQDEPTDESPDANGTMSTQYVHLKPAFVTNYGGVGRLRYLKADISLRVGDKSVPAVRRHMPYIRHTLVMLLNKATDEEVSSTQGRELVRHNALQAVQNVLLEEEGEHFIVDLLFNAFIVQR